MNNVLTLVGRLVSNVETKEDEKNTMIVLAVNRNYKSADGTYDTDFIDVELWGNMVTYVGDYCYKGDIIGVRGRLETYYTEDEDGTRRKHHKVVAEKVTFLSSKQSSVRDE